MQITAYYGTSISVFRCMLGRRCCTFVAFLFDQRCAALFVGRNVLLLSGLVQL